MGWGRGKRLGLRIGERGEDISRFLLASGIDGCCFLFIWLIAVAIFIYNSLSKRYRFFILRNTYDMGTSMYRAALLRVYVPAINVALA
jgi:hypothetical protein